MDVFGGVLRNIAQVRREFIGFEYSTLPSFDSVRNTLIVNEGGDMSQTSIIECWCTLDDNGRDCGGKREE
jgi:hypothetical protein